MSLLQPHEIESVKRRILSKTIKTESGCWLYPGTKKNKYGHAGISIHDQNLFVHRVAYEVFIGPIPDSLQVCHTCDVPNCVNPQHLFIGTQQNNVDDMWQKGRAVKPPKLIGLCNHKAVLTKGQVKEIQQRVAAGAQQREVAAIFNCSQSTVWRIYHQLTRAVA